MDERERTLEEREAELARREAALAAEESRMEARKQTLLNNGDPTFKNAKEHMYDRIPLTVGQMDVIIGVLLGAIVVFLVLGIIQGNMG